MDTRYFYNSGIYDLEALHSMGMSIGKQEPIIIIRDSVDVHTVSVNPNDRDNFTQPMVFMNGEFITLNSVLNNGWSVKPSLGGMCLILISSSDPLLGKLSNDGTEITYNNTTESLPAFYAHSDRLISRTREIVYKDGNELLLDMDNQVIVPSPVIDLYDDMVEIPELGMEFGAYAVTRSLFSSIMGSDPSSPFPCTQSDGDRRPVDNITTELAIAFCNGLSERDHLTPFYNEDGSESNVEGHESGYRIPTKREWEIAARAGVNTKFSGTEGELSEYGNDSHQLVFTSDPVAFEVNSNNEPIPVYDETSTYTLSPENLNTNPHNTSMANVGDSALSSYAWTKYNVRTGDVENVPQPMSYISGWGEWKVFKYNGFYYKSNAYGWAGVRGDADDNVFGTRAVGMKSPNAYGLYDMTGNVSELTISNGNVLFVGGDAASNTSKITIGHSTYEARILGMRVCRNI